ncbi:TPA: hypothetical protein JD836_14810 [Citrobacter freundii]|nr:hypothetical protein [Citrobacter freundii]HCD1268072.1 hypothetical protein [Citrobacter freundii]
MAQNVKKIAVVATFGRQPLFVQCVFIDGLLTFAKKKKLPKSGEKMAKVLIPELSRLVSAGFMVLVEEVYGTISAASGANAIKLDATHYDGRPLIVAALEHYHELANHGMISFDPGEETLFTLPKSLIDTEIKPNGETVSRINWEEMTTERMVTVLAVYATFYNKPTSTQYLQAMCGALDPIPDALTPFTNIVNSTQTKILNQHTSTSSLTGKTLPNGDRVL